ncbi:PREDICTED: uncharacterized protein LOC109217445 [Nicotiana attenuata]|uniref:uncharacterized protein LOC109217445 n=1 Tax=Nicotiana attenuata TaxID=49451 RepID=UPI0009051367|nr:PREDICTED: uncharacterized protein LOC109217445 [Nicotiana attenuata]
MRIFGCLGYVTDVKRDDKFSPRASPAIFLGYSMTQKGYRGYNIHTKEFLVSRDVLFKENVFPFQHPASLPSLFLAIDIPQVSLPNDTSHSLDQSTQAAVEVEPESLVESTHDHSTYQTSTTNNHLVETSPPRRSGRTSKPPIWLKDYATNPQGKANCSYPLSPQCYKNVSDSYAKALSSYSVIVEPQSYTEAIKNPKWIAAMKVEISALKDNYTWSIVKFHTGKVPTGCK